MAFSVLLLDDEPHAREGLLVLVDWEAEGFSVVAEAATIEEALLVLETRPIDLVIADIVLEDGSGLELLHEIAVRYPRTQRIIVSCHDRFEFAAEGMRAGASDFLFKLSLDRETLTTALRRTRTVLEKSAVSSHWLTRLRAQDVIADPLATVDPAWTPPRARRVSLLSVSWGRDSTSPVDSIDAFFCDRIPATLLTTEDPRTVVVTSLSDACGSVGRLSAELMVHLHLQGHGWVTIETAFGSWTAALFSERLSRMVRLDGRRFTSGPGGFLRSPETAPDPSPGLDFGDAAEARDLIRSHRYLDAFAIVERSLRTLALSGAPTPVIRAAAVELLWILRQEEEVLKRETLPPGEDKVLHARSLDGLLAACFLPFLAAEQRFHRAGIRGHQPAVARVVSYVRSHLQERVTLETAAGLAHMSPSYFSSVFKQTTGESFVSLGNRLRMEAAQRMLRAGTMSVADVAHQIGYEDLSYFSRLYRRYIGERPRDANRDMSKNPPTASKNRP